MVRVRAASKFKLDHLTIDAAIVEDEDGGNPDGDGGTTGSPPPAMEAKRCDVVEKPVVAQVNGEGSRATADPEKKKSNKRHSRFKLDELGVKRKYAVEDQSHAISHPYPFPNYVFFTAEHVTPTPVVIKESVPEPVTPQEPESAPPSEPLNHEAHVNDNVDQESPACLEVSVKDEGKGPELEQVEVELEKCEPDPEILERVEAQVEELAPEFQDPESASKAGEPEVEVSVPRNENDNVSQETPVCVEVDAEEKKEPAPVDNVEDNEPALVGIEETSEPEISESETELCDLVEVEVDEPTPTPEFQELEPASPSKDVEPKVPDINNANVDYEPPTCPELEEEKAPVPINVVEKREAEIETEICHQAEAQVDDEPISEIPDPEKASPSETEVVKPVLSVIEEANEEPPACLEVFIEEEEKTQAPVDVQENSGPRLQIELCNPVDTPVEEPNSELQDLEQSISGSESESPVLVAPSVYSTEQLDVESDVIDGARDPTPTQFLPMNVDPHVGGPEESALKSEANEIEDRLAEQELAVFMAEETEPQPTRSSRSKSKPIITTPSYIYNKTGSRRVPPRRESEARTFNAPRLELEDRISFRVQQEDIVLRPDDVDYRGTVFELADEISTPKGSRKESLLPTPDQNIAHWIKPEILLDEMWQKKQTLRSAKDDDSLFPFPRNTKKNMMNHDKWEILVLQHLKYDLNCTKSLLDRLPLQSWHNHTRRMNIANLVMAYVKRYFNPEFTSQAWGKFFEILSFYPVIPQEFFGKLEEQDGSEERNTKIEFNSVHLCEAPGAFVSALNHYLKLKYSKEEIEWNWLATTLNPYHEGNDISKMINDDRLIVKTIENWTFLEDSTGNILNYENYKKLLQEKKEKFMKGPSPKPKEKEKVNGGGDGKRYSDKKRGSWRSPPREEEEEGPKVMLVTADGSVDCQSNPGEQESTVAHLQFGEIISALSLLSVGGSFVLKIFTFLEAPTICHLYLLSCVFKEVHLFKPSTSKEGNSEVYVVCLGFLGIDKIRHVWQSKLVGKLATYNTVLEQGKVLFALSDIPKDFLSRIINAAKFFCEYQIKIIMRNLQSFGLDSRVHQLLVPYRKEAAEEWIDFCGLQAIQPKHRLITDTDNRFTMPPNMGFRVEHGCFADKAYRANAPDLMKLAGLERELESYKQFTGAHNHVLYGTFLKVGPVTFEKPYQNIRCSRFCLGSLLSEREELREVVKPYVEEAKNEGLAEMQSDCKAHELQSLLRSMSRNCDVSKDVEILCFNKLTWDFITKTDFQQQKQDLVKLFNAVNNLEKNRSIYLCRFNMLSRLQVGMIFCLTSVFEKVIIYVDADLKMAGIMLDRFKGLFRPEQKNMMNSISDVLDILTDEDFPFPVLQLVPMKALVDSMPCEFLVKYNIHILSQDLKRNLGVIHHLVHAAKTRKGEIVWPIKTSEGGQI